MAEISVKVASLGHVSTEYRSICSTLDRISSEIRGVKSGLGFDLPTRAQIERSLDGIGASITRSSRSARSMENALRSIQSTYLNTENKLSGVSVNPKGVDGGSSSAGSEQKSFWDTLWDVLIPSGLGGVITQIDRVFSVVSEFAKDVWEGVAKFTGGVITAINNVISNWKEFGGDLTNSRFWQEVVLETGIDIVFGAGVAAAAVALGAPAAVGALVAVAAGIVLDVISESICSKGFTEVISDFYIDADNILSRIGGRVWLPGVLWSL